jgi:MYXO-CTERM domain-containing protein
MALIRRAALAVLSTLAAGAVQAFTHDESVNGDFSGDRLAPTALVATPGVNLAAMSSATGDRDYFTFTVPTGWLLSAIQHVTYDSNDDVSFIALQAGTQLTEPPTGTNPGNLLGYLHFGDATVGSDILDNLAASNTSVPPAMGFTAPLGAGPYTFWVQQTGAAASYSLEFMLTPVPEPATWGLWLAGLAGVAAVRRRRFVRG